MKNDSGVLTCVSNATCNSTGWFTDDLLQTCRQNCDSDSKYYESTTGIAKCVATCDAANVYYEKNCSAECPENHPFNESKQCKDSCSTKIYDDTNKMCLNDTDNCVHYHIVDSVSVCTEDQNCTEEFPYRSDNESTECVSECTVAGMTIVMNGICSA